MDKQQIMEIILAEEQQLWAEVKNMTEHLGNEHEATQRAIGRWNGIINLIDKINEKTN
jgi:hypothetical protein